MSDFYIRLLLKQDGRIEDKQEDLDPADFGGTVPAVGDRFVQLLKGGCEGYRVVERTSVSDIEHLPRFSTY